ncbi:MAG: hypothetical protein JO154_07400 [Chitinophaga sp.]|uniref:hypothetical protein n=1 Tax=Chitinophaga sp. TaxID=1869181 RepID=UPI0025C161F7|nr:hypothetical protein [Chitinophaga sp.]MBV8252418.1 hypothetical protein [Chitinophaga sp.]
MTTFNQQGQHVNTQYNAGGDIHIGNIQNTAELITHLQQLTAVLEQLTAENRIDATVGADAKEALTHAEREAGLPTVHKATLVTYLVKAKEILTGVTAAEGLVQGITHLIRAIGGLFL